MQSWPPLICSQKKIIIFLILLHLTVHTDLKMIHFSNFRCSHSCHMTCYMTMLHCLQGALAFALLPCLWRSLTSFLPHTELKQTNWLCLRLKYTLMFPCNQPSSCSSVHSGTDVQNELLSSVWALRGKVSSLTLNVATGLSISGGGILLKGLNRQKKNRTC